MTRSVQQRQAIARRRREQEAATLREGPLKPTGPSAQLTELPGVTFEDIFTKEEPMSGNMAVREIPLGGGHLLKLDRADGLYRAAYYWTIPGVSPPRQARQAAAAATLDRVLTIVFGEASGQPGAADQDPATVEHYIRSTSWGASLP